VRTRRIRSLANMTLFVLSAAAAASGCASTGAETQHGLGVGQWQVHMPTTASPIQELAYGAGGYGGSARPALATVSEPLAAAKPKAKAARPRVAVAVAEPQQVAAREPLAVAEPLPSAVAETTQPTLLASNDQDNRYAQREAQASEQQKFRGGDAIVISAGAIVVVLLIVILILLLR
jgi:cobalamin biosynthesis Mg chelatase CobN